MRQEKDSAKEIIRLLDESVATLDTQIVSKLANARNLAVSALAERKRVALAVSVDSSGLMRLFGNYIHHHRVLMSTALVCSALLIAFLVTQQFNGQDRMEQGDAFLLASDLPPQAYLDKGFDIWLEQASQQ
ncbi:MAG: DUF3619 family protein [Methylophilaceae bacterium]